MLEKKITFDRFIRGIISFAILIGILCLVNYLSSVLLPFFIAWLIAYMIYPMVIFFQYKARLKNRVVSIFVTMIVLLSILTLASFLLVPPIGAEFSKLKAQLGEHLIHGDFLKTDLSKFASAKIGVIGNFPYNISSQIFFQVLKYRNQVDEVVGMIQKEVAERLAAGPGSKRVHPCGAAS